MIYTVSRSYIPLLPTHEKFSLIAFIVFRVIDEKRSAFQSSQPGLICRTTGANMPNLKNTQITYFLGILRYSSVH